MFVNSDVETTIRNHVATTFHRPPSGIRKGGSGKNVTFKGLNKRLKSDFYVICWSDPPYRIPLWGTVNLWREAFEIWRGSDDKQDHHAMMPARVQEAWGTDNRVDHTGLQIPLDVVKCPKCLAPGILTTQILTTDTAVANKLWRLVYLKVYTGLAGKILWSSI